MKFSWDFHTFLCYCSLIVVVANPFLPSVSCQDGNSTETEVKEAEVEIEIEEKSKNGKIISLTTSTNSNGNEHYPGEVIFDETFDEFRRNVWRHEISMAGNANGEFQMYDNDPANSYVKGGNLYITPTFTVDKYGSEIVRNGSMDLGVRCTDNSIEDCSVSSTSGDIVNPIVSARINTRNSFGFRYGVVEVRAKIPSGDWQWPAIWLMPQNNTYGLWPMSGEIDIMEARSNRVLFTSQGRDIGANEVGATLHFGINRTTDRWRLTHATKHNPMGFHSDFHVYGVVWTPDYFKFTLDGKVIGTVTPPDGGFWEMGKFQGDKIWSDDKMSPFDQKFYIILNCAVGGTSGYFPDNTGPARKPWKNSSTHARMDFWNARNEWKPSWSGENGQFAVDYVRVYAL